MEAMVRQHLVEMILAALHESGNGPKLTSCRRTVASLRRLFGDKEWVDAHTVFVIRERYRDQGDGL
jgi:hypothetical protein